MNLTKTYVFLALQFSLAALALAAPGCAPPSVESDEEAADDAVEGVSCAPLMSVFPVGDAHNIGYDPTCNDGTCDISCPDQHANSDWGGSHHGIDIFAYRHAPLVAVSDGTIERVGVVSDTSGLRVRLRDACGWEYYYGHLQEAFVSPGQFVHAGDVIGTMGNSGTGGVHLHFNVSPNGGYSNDINPFDLLKSTSGTACQAEEEPPPPPPPAPEEGCGVLQPGQTLGQNEALWSCDGRFVLVMQGDGNLVLYQGATALWHTGTFGTDSNAAGLYNGNLLVGGPTSLHWASGSSGPADSVLIVQDDGNLVIYSPAGSALWDSHTCCR